MNPHIIGGISQRISKIISKIIARHKNAKLRRLKVNIILNLLKKIPKDEQIEYAQIKTGGGVETKKPLDEIIINMWNVIDKKVKIIKDMNTKKIEVLRAILEDRNESNTKPNDGMVTLQSVLDAELMRVVSEYPEKKNLSDIKRLVELGADIHQKDDDSNSFLHVAAAIGDEKLIKFLLKKGLEKSQRNSAGDSAALVALFSVRLNVVDLLLTDRYATRPVELINIENRNTPLHQLAILEEGDTDNKIIANLGKIVGYILSTGYSMYDKNNNGKTPLEIISQLDNSKLLGFYTYKENPKILKSNLFLAVKDKNLVVIKEIVENINRLSPRKKKKFDIINTRDANGRTPLHYAAINKNHEIYNYLIGQGADPTIQDNYCALPIIYSDNMESITLDSVGDIIEDSPSKSNVNLIENDADTTLGNDDETTQVPASIAAYGLKMSRLEKKVLKGSIFSTLPLIGSVRRYVKKQIIDSNTFIKGVPLARYYLEGKSFSMLRYVIKHGPQIENLSGNQEYINELFDNIYQNKKLSRRKKYRLIKLLLEHGVDPNLQYSDGRTVGHIMALDGKLKDIKLLARYNIATNIQDGNGHTMIYYAKGRDNSERKEKANDKILSFIMWLDTKNNTNLARKNSYRDEHNDVKEIPSTLRNKRTNGHNRGNKNPKKGING